MGEPDSDLASAVTMFSWVEYSVFSTMLLISLLIGVYYGWFKKQDTVAEYMLGGKKMGVFPITISMVSSHVSGITLLGVPAEHYTYGTQYCGIFFCYVAVYFMINRLFLPVFYHLQLNSLYEYLELRFSKGTRTLGSLVFAISLIFLIPLVVYVPALAFNQVTGISVHLICPIVSLICIFYTSFGGLKAVVWTDTLQGIFTLGTYIFVMVVGFYRLGSFWEIVRVNEEGGRMELFNLTSSPFERNTFWTSTVGSILFWIAHFAVHPGATQRFIAVSSFKKAKVVTFWSCVGFAVVYLLVLLMGMLLYATYHQCDPVATKVVEKTGQMVPHYVMTIAKDFPGVTGLFISGILSSALSSMSAGLNTVAGTLYEDFVMFVRGGDKLSEVTQNLITKVIVLVLGLVCAALVLVVEQLGGLFQMVYSLVGITNGALSGIFVLGLFFPRANAKGALAGGLMGLIGASTVGVGAQYYFAQGMLKYPGKATSVAGCPVDLLDNLGFNASLRVDTYVGVGSPVVADDSVALIFRLSFMYYCAFGFLTVLVVGLTVSYLTEPVDPKCLDPRLFSPCVRGFLPQSQPSSSKPPPEEYTLVKTTCSPQDEEKPADPWI